jgi:putative membrane protein
MLHIFRFRRVNNAHSSAHPLQDENIAASDTVNADANAETDAVAAVQKPATSFRWGYVFLTALCGLLSLLAGIWLFDTVNTLLARNNVIGWLATGMLGLVIIAALMLILREVVFILRIGRMVKNRSQCEQALANNDQALARKIVSRLQGELAHGKGMSLNNGSVSEAREILETADTTLLSPLDTRAEKIIASSARRISVVTIINPLALVDMLYVAFENLRMLHRLAVLYGCRPGILGLARLLRMVVTNMTLAGGIAIGNDLLQQLIGHKITAKLSARLGEGVFNGIMAARIGLTAMEIIRPLPFIATKRPKMRNILHGLRPKIYI